MTIKRLVKYGLMWFSSIIYRNHCSKLLYYHDICKGVGYASLDTNELMGTNIELFRQHVRIIKEEGYEIVPRITKRKGEVAILLDDGFRGIWENRQFFFDNNICPTIFLPVLYIGRTDEGILSKDEILDLQSHGFIFECHTWSHEKLSGKSDEELKKELGDSKLYLSKFLSKKVEQLCLPLGLFTDHLLSELKKYDYKEIYSCIPGNYDETVFGMRRRNLCQFATPLEFRLILRGGKEIYKNLIAKRHHVQD